jgi:hypothetical protein
MTVLQLHAFAYMANVLAPIWDLPAFDGKILKRRGGPFYPSLQMDLDRLVGRGVAVVSRLGHVPTEEGRWRLEGSYRLNRDFARGVLAQLDTYPDERRLRSFIRELAFALSALSDDELVAAVGADATYVDSRTSSGNVIDFGEWRDANYSEAVARRFVPLIPGGGNATVGEQLHLYARHLQRRVHASR